MKIVSGMRSGRTQRAVEHAANLAKAGHPVAFVVASHRQGEELEKRLLALGGTAGRRDFVDFGTAAVRLLTSGEAADKLRGAAVDVVTDHLPVEFGPSQQEARAEADRLVADWLRGEVGARELADRVLRGEHRK